MRTILTILSLLSLACAGTVRPTLDPDGPRFLESIRPLHVKIVDLGENSLAMNMLRDTGMLEEAAVGDVKNICTASATNHVPQYWVTAAHCVVDIGSEGRYIEGTPIEIVKIDKDLDLAVFKVAGVRVRGLALQKKPAGWLQEILIVGHPFGYNPVFITRGYVSNPRAFLDGGQARMLFNCASAPGNSGSPVLNLQGEVVSVLQFGWGQGFSPVTGGALSEAMQVVAEFYAAPDAPLAAETPTSPAPVSWD